MKLGTWSSSRKLTATKLSWRPREEARRRKRLEMSLPLQTRPLDSRFADKEDVGEVVNFHSEGMYFTTPMMHYAPGMKVVVTFPYAENAPVQRKFYGTVVRVEHCWLGTRGVALSLNAADSTPSV
jgi:hypothetical protein